MTSVRNIPRVPPRLRNRLVVVGLGLVLVWLTFFDSHSFYRRATWWYEAAELRVENEELRGRVERLEESVARGLTPDEVEKIAREQYGMRRPGEKIYREDSSR